MQADQLHNFPGTTGKSCGYPLSLRIETSFLFPPMVYFFHSSALTSIQLSGYLPIFITTKTYPHNKKGMICLEISLWGGWPRNQSITHDDPWNLYDHHIHHLFFPDPLF
jgi:hypothetical protein